MPDGGHSAGNWLHGVTALQGNVEGLAQKAEADVQQDEEADDERILGDAASGFRHHLHILARRKRPAPFGRGETAQDKVNDANKDRC